MKFGRQKLLKHNEEEEIKILKCNEVSLATSDVSGVMSSKTDTFSADSDKMAAEKLDFFSENKMTRKIGFFLVK